MHHRLITEQNPFFKYFFQSIVMRTPDARYKILSLEFARMFCGIIEKNHLANSNFIFAFLFFL